MTTKLLFLGLVIAVPAQAQAPRQTAARWTLGAGVGGVTASTNLAGGADWRAGWSAAANVTYRLTGNFGLRGDALFAQNDLTGAGAAIPGEQRFNKFSYIGNAVLGGSGINGDRVTPYFLAGVGAIRVHDKGSDSSFTHFAGDLGLGLAYKLGRVGLRAEGRDLMYQFDRFGYRKTQNDMVWQGGVTLGL
jgi:outer membrane protein with beta-barrel domain